MDQKNGEIHRMGETIRLLRQRRRLSREQLSAQSGVSLEALEHYENNTWRPGAEMAGKLAAALQVTALELVNGISILHAPGGQTLLVSHMEGNEIRVVGCITEPDAGREEKEHD